MLAAKVMDESLSSNPSSSSGAESLSSDSESESKSEAKKVCTWSLFKSLSLVSQALFFSQPSKRDLARREEVCTIFSNMQDTDCECQVPQWQPQENARKSKSRATSTSSTSPMDVNKDWPVAAHYVPPDSNTRVLGLMKQSSALKMVIQAAIHKVVGDALFETAYPDGKADSEAKYLRTTFKQCAREYKQPEISRRCKHDDEFMGHIGRLVCFTFHSASWSFHHLLIFASFLLGLDSFDRMLRRPYQILSEAFMTSQMGMQRHAKSVLSISQAPSTTFFQL